MADAKITFDKDKVPPVPSSFPAEAPDPEDPQYVLELFDFDGSQAEFRFNAGAGYLTVMKATMGWERIVLASAVTGNPNAYMQLWKVPRNAPQNVAGKLTDLLPTTLEHYQNFVTRTSRMERIVLEGLPYDPQHGTDRRERSALVGIPVDPKLTLAQHEELPAEHHIREFTKTETIMLVRVSVRDGAMPRLIYAKESFFVPTVTEEGIPEAERELNWTLQFGGYVASNTSPGATIFNCWKLPDSASLVRAMVKLAHNSIYGDYVAPCVVREDQNLYSVISGAS